jgi:hypothetical protein
MAKRRKPVDVIEIDRAASKVKTEQPPPCYNGKTSYCRKDLCGKWFEGCESEECHDHTG